MPDECIHGIFPPAACVMCRRTLRRGLMRAGLPIEGVVAHAEAGFDGRCPLCGGFIGLGEDIFKLGEDDPFVCSSCTRDA